jgi:hypothetical protein
MSSHEPVNRIDHPGRKNLEDANRAPHAAQRLEDMYDRASLRQQTLCRIAEVGDHVDGVQSASKSILESPFNEDNIREYETYDDDLVVIAEARCVRFFFKARMRRLPLKSFLDW